MLTGVASCTVLELQEAALHLAKGIQPKLQRCVINLYNICLNPSRSHLMKSGSLENTYMPLMHAKTSSVTQDVRPVTWLSRLSPGSSGLRA